MHKLAPNEVKECRNRSANPINRKRTNFCIEPTPPKNSHRKKNSRKKSIRKKIFLKNAISEIYFEIYEKLRIFQILKINFQIYRKFPKILPLFEKNYHLFQNLKFSQFSYIFEKKNLTFSKIMLKVQKFSEILKFLKNWEFFRFWKLIFKYIGNFRKKLPGIILRQILSFFDLQVIPDSSLTLCLQCYSGTPPVRESF